MAQRVRELNGCPVRRVRRLWAAAETGTHPSRRRTRHSDQAYGTSPPPVCFVLAQPPRALPPLMDQLKSAEKVRRNDFAHRSTRALRETRQASDGAAHSHPHRLLGDRAPSRPPLSHSEATRALSLTSRAPRISLAYSSALPILQKSSARVAPRPRRSPQARRL